MEFATHKTKMYGRDLSPGDLIKQGQIIGLKTSVGRITALLVESDGSYRQIGITPDRQYDIERVLPVFP